MINWSNMEEIDSSRKSMLMELEALQIKLVQEGPSDKENFFSFETSHTQPNDEFENMDKITEDIVAYLESTLANEQVKDKSEKADLATCTVCRKRFESRKLSYHFRTHFRTAFTCAKCNLSFQNDAELKDHFRSHNEEVALYACSICNQSFATTSILTRHITVVHRSSKKKSIGAKAHERK